MNGFKTNGDGTAAVRVLESSHAVLSRARLCAQVPYGFAFNR